MPAVVLQTVDENWKPLGTHLHLGALWQQAAAVAEVDFSLVPPGAPIPAEANVILSQVAVLPTPDLLRQAAQLSTIQLAHVLPYAEPNTIACVLLPAGSYTGGPVDTSGLTSANRRALAVRPIRFTDNPAELPARYEWSEPAADPAAAPFLSIITRTQGTRLRCLNEMLATLAVQTDTDFEVVLTCHQVGSEDLATIGQVIDGQFPWLADRIRLLQVAEGSRSAPLNAGFAAAKGRYIAVLDDDDLVFDHYVQTFRELAAQGPGQVLRANAVRLAIHGHEETDVLAAVWPPTADWPTTFDLLAHVRANYSPCMTVAFPQEVFTEHGLRYAQDRDTAEDWQFLVHAAAAVGVCGNTEITSVYRWWEDGTSSRTQHQQEVWDRDRAAALASFDGLTLVLPPGSASRIRHGLEAIDEAAALCTELAQVRQTAAAERAVLVEQLAAARAHGASDAAELKIFRTRHRLLWCCWRLRRLLAREGIAGLLGQLPWRRRS